MTKPDLLDDKNFSFWTKKRWVLLTLVFSYSKINSNTLYCPCRWCSSQPCHYSLQWKHSQCARLKCHKSKDPAAISVKWADWQLLWLSEKNGMFLHILGCWACRFLTSPPFCQLCSGLKNANSITYYNTYRLYSISSKPLWQFYAVFVQKLLLLF